MNRAELIEALATRSGVTKVTTDKVVAELLDIIGDTLAAGDKLTLVGFGAFSVGTNAARTGRNPKTGEAMAIPASKKPKFTPGATLKAKVIDILPIP